MSDINDDPIDTELEADIAQASGPETPDDGLGPIDALIAERDEWKDRALRAAAEADNTRRRAEGQMNDARAYAIQRFSKDLLGVADSLQRALTAAPRDADPVATNLVTGLELIEKSLLQAFDANGLKRVAPEAGEIFDPHQHQAVMEQPSETVAGGTVIQTLQPGYALFGRTVRPAMVVVAAKGSGPAAGANPYDKADETGGRFDETA